MRNQGEGDEGRGRMWMRMTAIAEAFLGRTATSYCIVGPLAEGQRKGNGHPLEGEFSPGLLPRFSSLILYIVTARMDPQGSYTGIMEYQIKSKIGVSINWLSITLTRRETHNASRRIVCTKNEAGARLDSIQFCRGSPNAQTTD